MNKEQFESFMKKHEALGSFYLEVKRLGNQKSLRLFELAELTDKIFNPLELCIHWGNSEKGPAYWASLNFRMIKEFPYLDPTTALAILEQEINGVSLDEQIEKFVQALQERMT